MSNFVRKTAFTYGVVAQNIYFRSSLLSLFSDHFLKNGFKISNYYSKSSGDFLTERVTIETPQLITSTPNELK